MSNFTIRMKTDVDTSGAQNKIEQLIKELNDKPINLTTDIGDLTKVLGIVKEIEKASKGINFNGTSKQGKSGTSKALSEFKALTNQYNALQKQLAKETNPKAIKTLETQMNDVGKAIERAKANLKGTEKLIASEFNTTATQKLEASLSKTFSNLSTKADKLGKQINDAFNMENIDTDELVTLRSQIEGIQEELKTFNTTDYIADDFNELAVDINKISEKFKELKTDANNIKLEQNFNIDCTKAIGQLEKLKNEYKELGRETDEIDSLISKMNQLQSSIGKVDLGNLKSEFKSVSSEMANMKNSTIGATKHTSTLKRAFDDVSDSFRMFAPGQIIGEALISGVYNLKEQILELDKAMTNLKKVANDSDVATAEQIKGITNNSVEIAKEVAGTVPDVINASANALQSGAADTMEAAQEIAKYAQILANVGDISTDETAKGISTILNAFQLNPLDEYTMSVNGVTQSTTQLAAAMDMLNYASNTQAIDMAGLIQAFQNGGSTLASYGLNVKEVTALTTAANSSIQNAQKVGNGLKSIAANFAGLNVSMKDGSITMNKTAIALQSIAGIDIYANKQKTQVKSMTTILEEVQKKWGDLSDTQQKALSIAISGKTQSAVFTSLMQNYDVYKELMDEFARGDQWNSALNENAKYIDSINGKLAQLKATWVGIADTVFNSNMLKDSVSALTVFSEGLGVVMNGLDKMNLLLPTIIGGLGGLIKTLHNIRKSDTIMEGLTLTKTQLKGFVSGKTELVKSAVAANGLKGALSLIGKIALPVAAIGAIGVGLKVAEENANKYKKAQEQAQAAMEKHQSNINGYKQQLSSIEAISEEYNTLKSKAKLSNEEQERFKELTKQIADIMPDLVTGYDTDGNPILSLSGDADDLIEKLKLAIQLEKEAYASENRSNTKAVLGDTSNKSTDEYKAYTRAEGEYQQRYANVLRDRKKLLEEVRKAEGEDKKQALAQLKEKNAELTDVQNEFKGASTEYKNYLKSANQDVSKYLTSYLNGLDSFKDGGEDTQKNVQKLIGAFDFSQFDEDDLGKLESATDTIMQLANDKKLDTTKLSKQITDLNSAFGSGDVSYDEYTKQLDNLVNTYAKATDIDPEILRKLFSGVDYDISSNVSRMDEYSKELQNVLDQLIMLEEHGDNGTRMKSLKNMLKTENLGEDIKDQIKLALADKEITDQELELIMGLTIDAQVENEQEFKEKQDQLLEGLKELKLNDEVQIDIMTQVTTGDVEGLQESLGKLDEEKRVEVLTEIAESGLLDIEELNELIELIPEEKRTEILAKAEKDEVEELETSILNLPEVKEILVDTNTNLTKTELSTLAKNLDALPIEKSIKIDVLRAAAEGDLETVNKLIKDLPPEVQTQIKAEISNAMNGVYTVNNAKVDPKDVIFTANDSEFQSTYQSIKDLPPIQKAVQFVVEGVKNVWNALTGNGESSVGQISNVSDSPEAIDNGIAPMSEGISNVSDTPTESGGFFAKAKSTISDIFSGSTTKTSINISNSSVSKAIKYNINLFQELENRIEKVNNALSQMNEQLEYANGTQRIKYLKEQNTLYEEQVKLQEELYTSLQKEKDILSSKLKSAGFTIDAQGNLRNYEETLTKLNDAYDKAQAASESYEGKSESKKESLSKSVDKAKEKLDDVTDLTERYLELQNSELPNAKEEWLSLKNSIKDIADEIERLEREDRLYTFVNSAKQFSNELDTLNDKIDLLDVKMEYASDSEKFEMMKQKTDLLNESLTKQQGIIEQLDSQIKVYQEDLAKYGAEFDSDGNIANLGSLLNKYQNTEDLEKINDLVDEYIELTRDELPDSVQNYEELKNAIQDVAQEEKEMKEEMYQNRFDVIVDIEEKITDKYKDEIEKRKEILEENCEKEIELINKIKDLYEDTKAEEDYEEKLKKQQEVIADINRELELYRKDNSLHGQSKVQELLEQLQEEQNELQEIIDDRSDDLINDMFDSKIDEIERESEETIKALEDTWTDSKIAEMVEQAIKTNTFTDLDGNVRDLEAVMLEFAEESENAFGLLGDSIKTELVDNLKNAHEWLLNCQEIMDGLQLTSFETLTDGKSIPSTSNNKNISINTVNFEINGNNSEEIGTDLKDNLEDYLKDIVNRV